VPRGADSGSASESFHLGLSAGAGLAYDGAGVRLEAGRLPETENALSPPPRGSLPAPTYGIVPDLTLGSGFEF
jgi:hypothetical protein